MHRKNVLAKQPTCLNYNQSFAQNVQSHCVGHVSFVTQHIFFAINISTWLSYKAKG